jgi:hypothetical protein
MMKKSVVGLAGVLLLAGGFALHAQGFKLKVRVDLATVRDKPDVQGQILGYLKAGTFLDATQKAGEWYSFNFLAQDGRTTLTGYVQEGAVELVSGGEPPPPAAGPSPARRPSPAATGDKSLLELQRLEENMRQESVALLSLIKKMQPEESSQTRTRTVAMVRVNADGCSAYDRMDVQSNVIYRPRLNDEYELVEKNDGFYKVALADGRQAWLPESCVQPFSASKTEAKIKYAGVESTEVKQFLDSASDLYSQISKEKIEADLILKGYRGGKPELDESAGRIQKYYDYASRFYRQYIENKAADTGTAAAFLAQISAWAELLFGSSSFGTDYLDKTVEKYSGGVRDLSLGGNMTIDESSRVDVRFANKRDILQTPFSTTDVDAAYSYKNQGGLAVRAGVVLNSYKDEKSALNDYSRTTLKAGVDVPLGAAFLNAEYSFLQNSFGSAKDNNYGNHLLMATAKLKPKAGLEYAFQLRSSLESGKSDFYNFTNLEPSLSVTTSGLNSRLTFRALYESFNYPKLDLRSYGRAAFSLAGTAKKEKGTLGYNLEVTSKTFTGNALQNYVQVRGQLQTQKTGNVTSSWTPSFFTNLYTKDSTNSFTEFRLDWNNSAASFFGDVSTYVRVWHSPGTPVKDKKGVVKPYVLDVTGKAGIVIKNFRIGPSFGVHALFSAEDETFFQRDGNLFRFGGVAEGTIALPKGGTLNVSASYEYGFVYNNEVSINMDTGDVVEGDLLQRHPTTFQVNSSVSYPILPVLEVIGRLNYYVIKTDMTSKLSINPTIQNNRFTFVVGVRFHYN